jgi:hypothetical protein
MHWCKRVRASCMSLPATASAACVLYAPGWLLSSSLLRPANESIWLADQFSSLIVGGIACPAGTNTIEIEFTQ